MATAIKSSGLAQCYHLLMLYEIHSCHCLEEGRMQETDASCYYDI